MRLFAAGNSAGHWSLGLFGDTLNRAAFLNRKNVAMPIWIIYFIIIYSNETAKTEQESRFITLRPDLHNQQSNDSQMISTDCLFLFNTENDM